MTGDRTRCALCGLACDAHPVMARVDGVDRAFCCAGCLNVHAILSERGDLRDGIDPRDTEIFRRSLELGLVSTAGPADSGAPLPPATPTVTAVYQLSGLWCGSCAWLIGHALGRERGVVSADVSFTADLLHVCYAPQYVSPDRIVRAVERLGYTAEPFTGRSAEPGRDDHDLLLRLGIAAFLWMNVMTFNAVLYVGYFEQIPDVVRRFLPVLLMALSAPAVFYSAWPIHRLAALGLRARLVRMETLLSLGILSAYVYSVVETIRGGAHVYFDTACAIVALVLAGKWIEQRARERTRDAMTLLHRSLPQKARIGSGDRDRYVSIDALRTGDCFLVKAGERVPADGVVVEGQSDVDESLLTGESAPAAKRPGDEVAGGTVNLAGPLRVRTLRAVGDSRLSQMMAAVERTLAGRTAIERTVDRVARVFVPAVVAIAALTCAATYAATQSPSDAVLRAIAVLVIACPCALGIATPLAMTAAVGSASRAGVLITNGDVLETIRRLDLVILDKTGTVTTGAFALKNAPLDDLGALASLERASEHLVGRAIVAAAQEHGIALGQAAKVEISKGEGIRGEVDGRIVTIGRRSMFGDLPTDLDAQAREAASAGETVVYYSIGDDRVRILTFGDTLRADARPLVDALHRLGLRVVLLSGDSAATTAAIGEQLGVDGVHADALPEDKVRFVADAQRGGLVVAMVGDGANDAPALAQASLGVAMGSGTDLAMRAAAMVLMRDDLACVPAAFDIARRTLHVVRQNLFWAFFYNTAGIGLAAAGLLHPIFAAAGMVLSSVTVVGNSVRLGARDALWVKRDRAAATSAFPRTRRGRTAAFAGAAPLPAATSARAR